VNLRLIASCTLGAAVIVLGVLPRPAPAFLQWLAVTASLASILLSARTGVRWMATLGVAAALAAGCASVYGVGDPGQLYGATLVFVVMPLTYLNGRADRLAGASVRPHGVLRGRRLVWAYVSGALGGALGLVTPCWLLSFPPWALAAAALFGSLGGMGLVKLAVRTTL